jgi:serine/threonine-protein kinase
LSDRIEAMKIVRPEAAPDAALAERFLREIKVHASMEHPNIAAMRTALRMEDRIVMIMELVEGSSLAAVLKGGPLQPGTALSYAGQVLSALTYAHARGVVHRDIKPANIIVTPSGVVKVTDFGIARMGGSDRLTLTGVALGSLYYMSPEQVRGAAPDARSDIYSLGVTLYEMVTGVPPMRGENEYAIMHAHLTEEPVPPVQLVPALPAPWSEVILRAMAKAPERRFQSAEEFRTALCGPGEPLPAAAPVPSATAALDPEEVTRVESSLMRAVGPIARHLISQASRRAATIEELCHILAEHIPNEQERAVFLRSCTKAVPTGRTTTGGRTGPGPLSEDVLAEARRKLAPFIGPVAKILVDRTARKAHTAEELYSLLAREIPSDRERQSFLSSIER